jgi:hypothetical protein
MAALFAGGGDGEPIADEYHDVSVVVAGEAQWRELGDRAGRDDGLEEAADLVFSVPGAVPGCRGDRGVG